jgi:hypothetical protein
LKHYAEAAEVNRLFDLYIIQHYHYLLQLPGGRYITMNDRSKPIRRYMLDNHIAGKATLGTFAAGFLTKFITFDVDYRDNEVARWITYKLAAELDACGVGYAISYSGSKGYHVDVFLDKAIGNDTAARFFDFITKAADVTGIDGGEVEFRPAALQGVKLPLGVHQKTGNYCGFCTVESGLSVMGKAESEAHLLTIKKTRHEVVLDLIAEEAPAYEVKDAVEMENAVARHKPLETYDQSESYTLKRAADRYETGLTGLGQRHKSFLLLARFMNHHGVDRGKAHESIAEWLAWQDTRFYSSRLDECLRDLGECIEYVYDNDLTLTAEQRDLTVSMAEIDAIIRTCPQKNHKALAYAMLVHAKRWAGTGGAFYMTYQQMGEAAGIDWRTAFRQVERLEKLGVIQVVNRNRKQVGTFIKRPNVYRLTLAVEDGVDSGGVVLVEGSEGDFGAIARHFYTDEQLRKMLPRRQYESLIGA